MGVADAMGMAVADMLPLGLGIMTDRAMVVIVVVVVTRCAWMPMPAG